MGGHGGRPPSGLRGVWMLPALAGAGGVALVVALRRRRRRGRGANGAWRRSLRSPFHVNTVPEELRGIGVAPGLAVLEVGCGAGAYLEEAARTAGIGGEARGLEPDPEQARLARTRLRDQGLEGVQIDTGPTNRLPYDDGDFDLAYLVAGLGRLRDREGTLRELRRVLKPGGRLAVTEHLADLHYVPASVVQRACVEAGFEIAETHEGRWDHTSAFRKPLTGALPAAADLDPPSPWVELPG